MQRTIISGPLRDHPQITITKLVTIGLGNPSLSIPCNGERTRLGSLAHVIHGRSLLNKLLTNNEIAELVVFCGFSLNALSKSHLFKNSIENACWSQSSDCHLQISSPLLKPIQTSYSYAYLVLVSIKWWTWWIFLKLIEHEKILLGFIDQHFSQRKKLIKFTLCSCVNERHTTTTLHTTVQKSRLIDFKQRKRQFYFGVLSKVIS